MPLNEVRKKYHSQRCCKLLFLLISVATPASLPLPIVLKVSAIGISTSLSKKMSSEEEQAVKAYLTEFSQKWLAASITKDPVEFESVMGQMGLDTDCLMIRPSGNPADMNTFKAMVVDGDILVKKQAIAEFTSFRLIADGKVAIVTYWEESEFSYKGNENKDRAKLTAVLEKTEEGKWKPIHFHRGSG